MMRPDGCFHLKSPSPWRSLTTSKREDSKYSRRRRQPLPAAERGWDGGCPRFVAVSPPLLSARFFCRTGEVHACDMVAAPQNLIIGDSRSLSLPFCSEFSLLLVTCVCGGGVFALNQGWGHQVSNVPTCRAGQLQTGGSADLCSWGLVRRGLHSICKQKSVGGDGYRG